MLHIFNVYLDITGVMCCSSAEDAVLQGLCLRCNRGTMHGIAQLRDKRQIGNVNLIEQCPCTAALAQEQAPWLGGADHCYPHRLTLMLPLALRRNAGLELDRCLPVLDLPCCSAASSGSKASRRFLFAIALFCALRCACASLDVT